MNYLIFGAVANQPYDLVKQACEQWSIDRIIFLGGFGSLDRVLEHRRFMRIYMTEEKKAIAVPALSDFTLRKSLEETLTNPDSPLTHTDKAKIRCGIESLQAMTGYHTPICRGHRLDADHLNETYRCVITSGALAGSQKPQNGYSPALSYSPVTEHDYHQNFDRLEREGCRVMISGSHKTPTLAYRNKNRALGIQTDILARKNQAVFPLDTSRRYVIRPGAYKEGHYAVIHTQSSRGVIIAFHRQT